MDRCGEMVELSNSAHIEFIDSFFVCLYILVFFLLLDDLVDFENE